MNKRMTARKVFHVLIDFLIILLGSVIYSLGVCCFVSPNDIAPGGVTGIAVILTSLCDVKLGTLILAINIPLLIAGFILLNKMTMLKTLFSVAVVTVVTDYIAPAMVPVYQADTGNGILAAIFGGLFMGIGLGLNYQREGTTGGTDIIIKIIQRFFPDFKIGMISFALDAVVLTMGMLVYKDINVVLFALVSIFVQSKCIDVIVYGSEEARFLLIFSEKAELIAEKLLEMDRGVTFLKGEGAYSKEQKNVVATAVHRSAYSRIKRTVHEIDPKAFIITTTTNEVLGEGFNQISTREKKRKREKNKSSGEEK